MPCTLRGTCRQRHGCRVSGMWHPFKLFWLGAGLGGRSRDRKTRTSSSSSSPFPPLFLFLVPRMTTSSSSCGIGYISPQVGQGHAECAHLTKLWSKSSVSGSGIGFRRNFASETAAWRVGARRFWPGLICCRCSLSLKTIIRSIIF